jgi:hypothetical protein
MSVSVLLERLDAVKQTGHGRWIARCPSHEDRRPSLNLRELDDGRILVICRAGCETEHILAAMGLSFSDLYPPRALGHHVPSERPSFPPTDVLRALGFEAMVVAVAAARIVDDEVLTEQDRARLRTAVERILAAVESTT